MKRAAVCSTALLLAASVQGALAPDALAGPRDEMIARHATVNGVPEALIRRVIHIESRGNPRVISKGNYGLMQIRLGTARAMGYSGTAEGLLDAETNMTYAVKYLAGAYRAARCNLALAVSYYQRGYYGRAQSKCSAPQSLPAARVAKSETNAASARLDAGTAPVQAQPQTPAQAHASDVLRPRVVQVETFTKADAAPVAGAKLTMFKPARAAPSPDAAAESAAPPAVTPVLVVLPVPRARPATAPRNEAMEAAKPEQPDTVVARLESIAVPLPPERPEIAPAQSETKRSAEPVRHARHRRGPRQAKAQEPVGLVALIQKLTAPEKRSRRRGARAQQPAAPTAQIY